MGVVIEDALMQTPGSNKSGLATHEDLWELWWAVHKAITDLVARETPEAAHLELARRWLRQNGVERVPGTPKVMKEHLEGLDYPFDL